jgi:hypothetical protein
MSAVIFAGHFQRNGRRKFFPHPPNEIRILPVTEASNRSALE